MTSRLKSAILRRTSSIKRPSVIGIKDTLRSARSNITTDLNYESNEYIHHQSFFDDNNYQSIIKCLDDGYKVSMGAIEYMQDYCDLQKEHAQSLTSYTNKWVAKLKQQSSLSSYHTTKRAQLQTIRSPNKLAQLVQSRCEAIQQVIDTYRRQVERMYPGERLGTVHKHYRTDTIKKAFKTAHSSLSKLSDALEKLHEDEKKAEGALHEADILCENLSLDVTASKKKLTHAKENQEKRQYELDDIQENIARTEKEYQREQLNYRDKAIVIYKECRGYEKERLDQIRETLINFSQAVHTSDCSAEQDTIFEDLLEKIKTDQDSEADLDFWAETYHVDISTESTSDDENNDNTTSQTTTPKPTKSHKNETESLPITAETVLPSVTEDEEEQVAKVKPKKSKNSVSTEKKNNSTTEPTTPNTTKPNQVK